ncbi:MAG: hypothetical protein M0R38_10525 [Bacteroidia bacterium]|jgi:hypothetical protein|nr:hypothetical protein [Bacteroidia bacterium]
MKLEINCNDVELEQLIRNRLSETNRFFNINDIQSTLFSLFKDNGLFKESKIIQGNLNSLIYRDQFRINKIISKMIIEGDLIFNIVGRKYYGNGIEVAWAGEK